MPVGKLTMYNWTASCPLSNTPGHSGMEMEISMLGYSCTGMVSLSPEQALNYLNKCVLAPIPEDAGKAECYTQSTEVVGPLRYCWEGDTLG